MYLILKDSDVALFHQTDHFAARIRRLAIGASSKNGRNYREEDTKQFDRLRRDIVLLSMTSWYTPREAFFTLLPLYTDFLLDEVFGDGISVP